MGKYKPKHRVRVVLSDLKDPEFSLGALLGHSNSTGEDARKKKKKKNKPSFLSDDEEFANDSRGFGNILKMLEHKYCGHAGMRSGTGEDGGTKKRAHKHDLYDLDDDIIDDSELHEVFEKQHEAQSVLTKYSGFFVNRGTLDVVGRKEDGEEGGKKKRGRKSGEEGGRKKPKSNGKGGIGGGEDDEKGGGDEGINEGKAKKTKKQQHHQQRVGNGEAGDNISVVSNSSSTMASGGCGGGGNGGSSASSSNSKKSTIKNKAKSSEIQAAAKMTFQDVVKRWRKEQQQSSPLEPTAAGVAAGAVAGAALDELPLALRSAALALDLVMRRPTGEKKYKSAFPGDNGLSSLYIDTLQTLLPLGGEGREGGRAWKKGLAEAAVGRVRVLKRLMGECLVGFKRHYEVKKERIAKRASSNSNSSSSKEERCEEGMEGRQDEVMSPPKSVPLDMKLKQSMYCLLTSLKERSSIQVLFAGQGLEGGAEGEEAEELLPLMPVKYEEEERKVLTTLAEIWPEEGMKIPRLRRAFNDYKGRQQLLQVVNDTDTAGGGGKGREREEGGALVLRRTLPKENGIMASAPAKLKEKTSPMTMATTMTTTKTTKKMVTVAAKQRMGPWKGCFKGLQRIPFNAADFEQEARND